MNTVTCQICGAEVTFIELHLTERHPDCDINTYTHKYPDAPLLSELAQDMLEKKAEEWGSNGKKTYSIKTLFNIKPFKSTVNAWGWEKPTEFVPAQVCIPRNLDIHSSRNRTVNPRESGHPVQ